MYIFLVTYRSQPYLHLLWIFVPPVKILNFEEYPSIATRGTAKRSISVPVNCT